jgi:hypothetical protein
MPSIDLHGMTNFQVYGEVAIAFFSFAGMVISSVNNWLAHKQSTKQDKTIQKVDDVHTLANGNFSAVSEALKTEQDKNAALQKALTEALSHVVAAKPPAP